MSEIWDAYDKNLNKIENIQLVRGETIPDEMYHLVCEVVVKHTDGTYLLMQRDSNKHLGGRWELTAGGSALIGETPFECAIRELYEETGIVSNNLQEVGKVVQDNNHSIYVEYLCVTDWDKNNVILQEGETIDFKWVDKTSILELKKEELAASRSIELIKKLYI